MGNRPNEQYAEMTVCLYLPDGRVGFMFKRPHIEGHVAHDAGGLKFDVVAPYEEHHVTYDGDVCVLVNPREMADPGTAFKSNPHEECTIDLRLTAVSQPSGGEPIYDEGEEPPPGTAHGFAKGHTEQQMAITGLVAGERRALRPRARVRSARPLVGPARLAEHLVVPLGHRQLRRSPRSRVHACAATRTIPTCATSTAGCSTSTATATAAW